MLTKIPFNSPVSLLTLANPPSLIKLDSPSNSNQYFAFFLAHWRDPSILLLKSAFGFARVAARYYAPTDVPASRITEKRVVFRPDL